MTAGHDLFSGAMLTFSVTMLGTTCYAECYACMLVSTLRNNRTGSLGDLSS